MLVNHWRRPLIEGIPAFERACRSGLSHNDTDFAFLAAMGITSSKLHCGRPLGEIMAMAPAMVAQMKAFNCQTALAFSLPSLQFVMCLQGSTEDPWVLKGDAMNAEQMIKVGVENQNHAQIILIFFLQLRLAYMFDRWETVKELLPLMEKQGHTNKLHWSYYIRMFDQALCYIELFRQSRQYENKKKAQNIIDRLDKWAREGSTNCHGLVKLLKAEQLSVDGDVVDVMAAYELALASFEATQTLHIWRLPLKELLSF